MMDKATLVAQMSNPRCGRSSAQGDKAGQPQRKPAKRLAISNGKHLSKSIPYLDLSLKYNHASPDRSHTCLSFVNAQRQNFVNVLMDMDTVVFKAITRQHVIMSATAFVMTSDICTQWISNTPVIARVRSRNVVLRVPLASRGGARCCL